MHVKRVTYPNAAETTELGAMGTQARIPHSSMQMKHRKTSAML